MKHLFLWGSSMCKVVTGRDEAREGGRSLGRVGLCARHESSASPTGKWPVASLAFLNECNFSQALAILKLFSFPHSSHQPPLISQV